MDNTQALATRLVDLEEKFSFQEDTLEQLNGLVTKQGFQIVELAAQLKSCKEQIDGLRERDGSEAGQASDERPPHY